MLPKSNCPFCHWSNFEHLKRFLKKNFRANEKKVLMRTQKKKIIRLQKRYKERKLVWKFLLTLFLF